MKTFKELVSQLDEVAEPRRGKLVPDDEKYEDGGKSDEGRFKDKHVIAKTKHPVADDAQFDGKIKGKSRKKRLADNENDESVYEEYELDEKYTDAQRAAKEKARGGISGREHKGSPGDYRNLGYGREDHQGRGLKKTHKMGDKGNYKIAQSRRGEEETGKYGVMAYDKRMKQKDSKYSTNSKLNALRAKRDALKKERERIVSSYDPNVDLLDILDEGSMADKVLIQRAIKIAERMGGNMTNAVEQIERLKPGLSKNSQVRQALRLANEERDWEDELIESILLDSED